MIKRELLWMKTSEMCFFSCFHEDNRKNDNVQLCKEKCETFQMSPTYCHGARQDDMSAVIDGKPQN